MKKRHQPSSLKPRRPEDKSNVVAYPGPAAEKRRYARPTASSRSNRMAVKSRGTRSASASRSPKGSLEHKVTPFYIWGDFDLPFLLLTLALLGFGLVMLFSASYARAYYYKDSSFFYIRKQIMWSVIGIVGMIAASFVNYHFLRKFVWPLYAVSIVLCMACYLFEAENGARRWVRIMGINFQPSEIGKFALILLFAHLMSKDQDKMNRLWEGTLRYLVLFGALAIVVVMQPHLSATLLLAGITVAMLFVGGANILHLLTIGGIGVAGIAAMVVTMWSFFSDQFAHVLVRLTYWLDPFASTDWGSYQTRQSLMAIGSGGLMGLGLGESRQKQLYLPEVQNDFVFAIICEELGFVGACLIIVLFALLIWRGYTIALHARDRFGALIAVGITTQIGMQVMLNIAVVTNTIPNTGISLPLFSYGGTSLCMILGELGILLAVSRQGNYEKE